MFVRVTFLAHPDIPDDHTVGMITSNTSSGIFPSAGSFSVSRYIWALHEFSVQLHIPPEPWEKVKRAFNLQSKSYPGDGKGHVVI